MDHCRAFNAAALPGTDDGTACSSSRGGTGGSSGTTARRLRCTRIARGCSLGCGPSRASGGGRVGDREERALVPAERLPEVAALIQARRKRRGRPLTSDQALRLCAGARITATSTPCETKEPIWRRTPPPLTLSRPSAIAGTIARLRRDRQGRLGLRSEGGCYSPPRAGEQTGRRASGNGLDRPWAGDRRRKARSRPKGGTARHPPLRRPPPRHFRSSFVLRRCTC